MSPLGAVIRRNDTDDQMAECAADLDRSAIDSVSSGSGVVMNTTLNERNVGSTVATFGTFPATAAAVIGTFPAAAAAVIGTFPAAAAAVIFLLIPPAVIVEKFSSLSFPEFSRVFQSPAMRAIASSFD